MAKLTYWQKRALRKEQEVNDGAKKLEESVATAYKQAQTYLTQQINKLFARTKQKTGLSDDEARKMLNETVPAAELVELRRLAKDITNPELQKDAKKRLNGLALKHRITRLEDLKAKSYLVSKQVADAQLTKQTDFYIDVIHDTYREATAESVIQEAQANAKKGVVIEVWNKKDYQFKQLSTRYTKNILESHWKGSNYSQRLWGDTEALARRLEELFTVETMTGMSEFDMARAIANEFNQSINVARRLIRTEANYMANQSKLKSWRDNGIKYYILLATIDLRTSLICRKLDHTVYLVSQAKVNENYPPFHPWCRTIASMYSKRTINTPRLVLDPISGKTFAFNGSQTYDDWMRILRSKYSDAEIDLQKKKIINAQRDNVDYRVIKSVLKKEAPGALDEYQNIKYQDKKRYNQLKREYANRKGA